ncbi:MAG: hypothetical protein P0107_00435 [Nitrosomonas sp.]|nr:hypothetical protein [Nitrosomonas sp.]
MVSLCWQRIICTPGALLLLFTPETELRCRDDVYQKISDVLTKGRDGFYVEAHRQRFISEILDAGGQDVLSRYVMLLEVMGSGTK